MSPGTAPAAERGTGAAGGRWARLRRPAFWVFALAVFVATHYPKLRIESEILPRPDLLIHASVFGTWTLLLCLSGYVGPGGRAATWLLGGLVALVYAAVDEVTQGVPWLHRTVALDDYLANAAGIVAVGLGGALVAQVRGRRAHAGEGQA